MLNLVGFTERGLLILIMFLSPLFYSGSAEVIAGWHRPAHAQSIDLGTLLDEMTDLKRLTELKDPAYRCIQFSSYDRRSTKTSDEGWFANSDGFGNEPVPGFEKVIRSPDEKGIGEYLVCDIAGPGAIVRLWTARIEGEITMFLDDVAEPLYRGPAQDFFLHLPDKLSDSGRRQNYSATFLQQSASYFPIPFSGRCRIVWTGDLKQLHFYHIGMRIYPPGTRVKTLEISDFQTFNTRIKRVADMLGEEGINPPCGQGGVQTMQVIVPKGSRKDVFAAEGEKIIESLSLKISANDMDDVLRKSILNIYFDHASIPQVQAPVGDFFGSGPGLNLYRSLPFSMEKDGSLVCRFPMPFSESVSIQIENLSGEDIELSGSVALSERKWDDERSMYFHAHWRRDANLVSSEHRIRDLPFLLALGRGRIVGTSVCVYNPSHVPTSWGNWWGEGDEKLFIDKDTFPSFFGTGSEDYFNYAWSSGNYFSHPYCGQTRNDGPGNRGYVSNHRWHILDDIPFYEMMAFYMELFSHDEVPGFSYARTVYLYGRPGLVHDHTDISADQLRDDVHPVWIPVGEKGSEGFVFREAEDLMDIPHPDITMEKGHMWSGGSILVWEAKEKGSQTKLQLTAFNNLTDNELNLTLRHDPGGGEIRVFVNDTPARIDGKETLDLYHPHRVFLHTHSLGKTAMNRGENYITLEFTGEPPKNRVGIDFIWLRD